MIRVQKGKFSGREIYDLVVAVLLLLFLLLMPLWLRREFYLGFFLLFVTITIAIKIAPLKPSRIHKNGKMKNAFRESLLAAAIVEPIYLSSLPNEILKN